MSECIVSDSETGIAGNVQRQFAKSTGNRLQSFHEARQVKVVRLMQCGAATLDFK
jgi:hypothetical protein